MRRKEFFRKHTDVRWTTFSWARGHEPPVQEDGELATTDVTLTDSIITGCPAAAPPSVQAIPTLGPAAMASLVALLAGMGLLVLRRLSI